MNKELWDWGDEQQDQESQAPKRSLFDNLGDAITAIGANFSDVRGSNNIGDLRHDLMENGAIMPLEEYNRKVAELEQLYGQREAARQQYEQAHQNLVNDDSFLKNIDQMGGTLEGMAAQGIGTAVGAGLGFLSPVVGGTAMGAKVGNAAGAVAGGYLDARSVALQAEEEVLDAGGTWEQAKQAYDEALKKASLTTLPETLADIAMGNRLVRAGLNSGVARKIAGSTLGRAGSAVLDPAARVGTKVSRMVNPLTGRIAGLATDVAMQGSTEALQEVTQDYIANREVAKALGQQDNEYSLGGFGRYAMSPEGLETMKTAGIMGGLFGGVGGAISSGQYLQRGSKYASSNKIHDVTEKMINEGKLSLNKEQRKSEEQIISAFTGISPAELSTWSDADIIAQSSEIRGEYLRRTSHSDETQDITGVRGLVDVINGVGDNQQQKAKTEGELTNLSNSVLQEYGVTPQDRAKFFSTPTENSLIEKAKKELQKQTEQTKETEEKPQTKIKLSPETAATMNINNGTIDIQDAPVEEGETTVLDLSQPAQQNTDGVISEVKYKDNIGERWEGFTEFSKDGQELEGKSYRNKGNGKVARITQDSDGTFSVLDTTNGNTQARGFQTLEEAEKHLIENQDNEKVFQSANQPETKGKTTLGEGEVDVDTSGTTGQHVGNVDDLFNFIQNNPDTISPEAFMEFVDMGRRLGTDGIDFYFDTKNYGYAKDDNGVYHQVRGWKQKRDKATGRALIQLYRGSDINTAVHEVAHVGYENLSKEDKRVFDTYAVKTMGRYIADLLNMNYDENFRNRLLNLANDEDLQNKINEQPAAFQAEIRLFLNGEVDVNNLTDDQQRAIDERWAWEFTFWYMEGYVRGVKPENIIQRILTRSCIFLGKELEGIRRVWWHIHHKNSGMESMYRDMNGEPMNGDEQIRQQTEQNEQNQPKQIGYRQVPLLQSTPPNFTMGEGTAARYVGNPNFTMEEELPNVNVDNIEDLTNNEVINMARQTKDESPYGYKRKRISEEMTRRSKNLGDERKEVGQYTGGEYNGSRDISTMIDAKVMNDTTAEIFADKLLDTYGDNVGAMRALMVKFYNQAKSDEERRWLTNIAKRALQKYQAAKNGTAYNQNGTYYAGQSQPNSNFGYASTEQPQSSNSEQTTVSPKQLNSAIKQETVTSPQVEEKFDTNDTIEEEKETEENSIKDIIEEVSEDVERIYKTGLEPQEITGIERDLNEVLDGLENESSKTVKKILQSTGKRIEAAKSALRRTNKETDRGQEIYKICSMSALKNILDSRLKNNYYKNGDLNQNSVNNVGNLIKTQLGEIQENWAKPYSEETENAARRDKKEADRIEKEKKEAERKAKRKQKEQVQKASQNLDILEQQIMNQKGEELTEEQLEEKAEKELTEEKGKNPSIKKKDMSKPFKSREESRKYMREQAKRKGTFVQSKNSNSKTGQVNDVVEGWIDRLSKEEDYNEAMSQLQELLNSNAITEEEYNDISKGIEEHFEGEEDTESKAEQAQEILNKAFPNKVFQYAWHGTEHDFDEFSLKHLLSGEGAMAHGWGLYFALDPYIGLRYARELGEAAVEYSGKVNEKDQKIIDDLSYQIDLRKEHDHVSIEKAIESSLKDYQWEVRYYEREISKENSEYNQKTLAKFKKYVDLLQNHKDEFVYKSKAKFLKVEIPENNVLLKEGFTFEDQPKFVQRQLLKLFKDKKFSNSQIRYLTHSTDIYKQLFDYVNEKAVVSDSDYKEVSVLLNKYGIKGISYTGLGDGKCVVIFDDKAIDIVSKFKVEEGKWKLEKVDNARNREIDKQKAQKKLEKRKNNDKRFMVHGKSAKGSPLTQEVLDQVENEYNEKMQQEGISVIQNINMKLRNKAAEDGIENVSDRNDPTFNDRYIQAHDKVNEYFWKKYKLFRGLDGEWRFWVSDDGAKLKVSGQDLANGAKFPRTFYSVFKLSEVLSHSKLFKNYPQLKNITVIPVWDRGSGSRGSFQEGKNGEIGTIKIKLAHPSFYSNETVDEEVIKVLLHETQHAIQGIEGFAQGGDVSADFLKTKPAMNFILRHKGELTLSLADKLQKGVPSYTMVVNGEKQKVDLSFEENPISGEYNPVVTINGKKASGTKNKVLSELLIQINSIKEDSVKLRDSDFDEVTESLSPKETEYLSKLSKMFDSGNFSLEFENKKLSKEESIQEAKKRLSFLHDKKQLNKILEDYEYGSTLNEDFNIAIENSGLSYELYKSLLGEAEARNTAESYKNKYRKGKVPMTLEESYIKAKNGTGQIRINKKRFMSAERNNNIENNVEVQKNPNKRFQTAEKTPLEKAKEQRDKRLEQQRKEGITSDFYKDVYSVSFTESAQQNEENKRKMEYFDKRTEYWDRSEKDGKVTYTRKTPFEHHQKVVTYNGINDVTKEQKKKSKPAQWAEWFKDQLIKYAFNDMHFLAKAARKLGKYDAYTKLVVTKGYALKANTAMQNGIKYNGETTRALNDIIKEVGEEKQHDFIEYCIAKRILDMKELRPEIRQKMSPEEAAELIEKYESGENAELFKKNQKDFVKYNHALLHVLVDGGIINEEEFQHHIKNDPNFVPLAKVMDDADFGFNGIQAARSIVNVKTPIKKIGTSFREVKNPFLEMQKRTAEYYALASRNKAGQIFVNEIAGAIDKMANGDMIKKGQGMIRKVKVNEKDGKLITKPDENQQIIYVCNNGKQEFYQVSDPEIYRALRALDADQMGTLHKMLDPFLHAPSALIRETATMVPDFGLRNILRDGGEAFLTSEHGFLPFIDQIWGMYQMANNTEWYQRFLEQQGEYGTYNRDGVKDDVARVEDTIDEKVNPIKNFNEIRRAAFEKFTNKKNSKATRAAALLQLMGSMPYAVIKSNKRINDYLEMGTRIGEFKNAKMGYNGTLDRLYRGGILDWGVDVRNARQSDILAAGAAKEITLNFGQHGIVGKQLNRYIPFFNATLQGIYKMCNALELMFTGRTLSGQKNHALQGELLFKAAMITAIGIGVAAAGEGDDDYEEANQYEKENFWILPNGLRYPKDQVLGKLFGNVAEKSYAQWRKGKLEPSDILKSIIDNFTPDKFMPATADIILGGLFNYDTFYKSAIVPEYMEGKLGHLQKDLSTSNIASDISDFLWKYTKTDVSAKRLDWALQKNLTNVKKYVDSIYDLGKQAYDPKSFNEKMARGYDKNDSTGSFVGGLKDDVPKPLSLITGTFATNRTNYKSISDFYEKYNDLKKLATDEQSMSKEDKRAWKRYEQAYKKDKNFRKQLRAIKSDSSLTGKQKREKADKIFKQQIKLAKWAEG